MPVDRFGRIQHRKIGIEGRLGPCGIEYKLTFDENFDVEAVGDFTTDKCVGEFINKKFTTFREGVLGKLIEISKRLDAMDQVWLRLSQLVEAKCRNG